MSPEQKKAPNKRLLCQKGNFYPDPREDRLEDTGQDEISDPEPLYADQKGIQTINVITGRRQSRHFLTIKTPSGKKLRLPGPGQRTKCVKIEVDLDTGTQSITRIPQVEAEKGQASEGITKLRTFQDLSYQQASRESRLPASAVNTQKKLRRLGQRKGLPHIPAL